MRTAREVRASRRPAPLGMVFCALCALNSLGAQDNPALDAGASNQWLNPAFSQAALGQGLGAELVVSPAGELLSQTYAAYGFGLGLGYRQSEGRSLVSLANAYTLPWGLSAGLRSDSDPQEALSGTRLSFGLLWRPQDALSLGAVWDEAGSPGQSLRFGAALRPLAFWPAWGPRLTLGWAAAFEPASGLWRGGDFRVAAAPLPGWTAQAASNPWTGGLNIGLAWAFDQGELQAETQIRDGQTATRGALFLGPLERQTSRLPPALDRRVLVNPLQPLLTELSLREPLLGLDLDPWITTLGQLEALTADPGVTALVVDVPWLVSNRAQAWELYEALQRFKAAGKKLYVHTDLLFLEEFLWASLADHLSVSPAAFIGIGGPAIERVYWRAALDRLGVRFRNLRSHDYKSAGNDLSEEAMTPAERESYRALLEDLDTAVLEAWQTGRGPRLSVPLVSRREGGPFLSAPEALAAGLVDGVQSRAEFRQAVEEQLSRENRGRWVEGPDWETPRPANLFAALMPGRPARPSDRDPDRQGAWGPLDSSLQPEVAVVTFQGVLNYVPGSIAGLVGLVDLAQTLRSLREEGQVKGLLLRIDSPGGSALASDLVARELARWRQAQIPVVVSFAGTAASGGYYIAAGADAIHASPLTVTGSLGVVALYPDVSALMARFGARQDAEGPDSRSLWGSALRPWQEGEEEAFRRQLTHYYGLFTQVVAEGRGLSPEAVEAAAQGRIWSAADAQAQGLVDSLGGLQAALADLKRRVGAAEVTLRIIDTNVRAGGLGLLQAPVPAGSALPAPPASLTGLLDAPGPAPAAGPSAAWLRQPLFPRLPATAEQILEWQRAAEAFRPGEPLFWADPSLQPVWRALY